MMPLSLIIVAIVLLAFVLLYIIRKLPKFKKYRKGTKNPAQLVPLKTIKSEQSQEETHQDKICFNCEAKKILSKSLTGRLIIYMQKHLTLVGGILLAFTSISVIAALNFYFEGVIITDTAKGVYIIMSVSFTSIIARAIFLQTYKNRQDTQLLEAHKAEKSGLIKTYEERIEKMQAHQSDQERNYKIMIADKDKEIDSLKNKKNGKSPLNKFNPLRKNNS